MSLLDQVVTGKIKKPKRLLVYGAQGVGKTSLASLFPKALFIATEEGTNELDVARIHLSDYKEVILAVREAGESDYETVVIDNDDTFIASNDENEECVHFTDSVGNMRGVGVILQLLGVKFEEC